MNKLGYGGICCSASWCLWDRVCQVARRRHLLVTAECGEVIAHWLNIRRILYVLWCIAAWYDGQCSMFHYSGHALGLHVCCKAALQCSEFNVETVWRQSMECQRIHICSWVTDCWPTSATMSTLKHATVSLGLGCSCSCCQPSCYHTAIICLWSAQGR